MKVRELQERLSKLDPGLDILCYSEHESLVSSGQMLRLLEIEDVSTTEAELVRLDDGTPYLRIGKSSSSATLALLEVGPDF